jgi:transposase
LAITITSSFSAGHSAVQADDRRTSRLLRLNAQTLRLLTALIACHEQTVRATIGRWQTKGLGGLWEAPGRGAKRKWQEADLQY